MVKKKPVNLIALLSVWLFYHLKYFDIKNEYYFTRPIKIRNYWPTQVPYYIGVKNLGTFECL